MIICSSSNDHLWWEDSKPSLQPACSYPSSTWQNPRLCATHSSMLVSGLLLTFTWNPSCLMNQSLYTVHSASLTAISISNRRTSSGMSLFISISEMFLPRQVRGPRPNYSRQLMFSNFFPFAAFLLSRKWLLVTPQRFPSWYAGAGVCTIKTVH